MGGINSDCGGEGGEKGRGVYSSISPPPGGGGKISKVKLMGKKIKEKGKKIKEKGKGRVVE